MRFVRKAPAAVQQPIPAILKKRVYTEKEVADMKRQQVETRRENEDRRKHEQA
jgi:hypothetical protein